MIRLLTHAPASLHLIVYGTIGYSALTAALGGGQASDLIRVLLFMACGLFLYQRNLWARVAGVLLYSAFGVIALTASLVPEVAPFWKRLFAGAALFHLVAGGMLMFWKPIGLYFRPPAASATSKR